MKRATASAVSKSLAIADFNPRPREEGDLRYLLACAYVNVISIHALVKRATIKIHDADFCC